MQVINKYWSIFKIQVANSLAYPVELFWRSAMIILFIWIFFQLWRITFTVSGTDTIGGLTLHDTLWYLMLAETIELSKPRLVRNISDAVKDGSIAYILNKPYDFLVFQMSTGLGESLFRMFLSVILGGATAWLMVGPPPDAGGWPLALAAMSGAWLINFCVNAMIGLAAFVVEEVAPFEWIYQKLVFILGGMLIPLDFYPVWLQRIAKALPFSYTMYGPAHLFVTPDLSSFGTLMLGQLLWLAILGGVLVFVYRRSIRRLSINGG